MSEFSMGVLFLGLIAVSLIVLTASVVTTAAEARVTLRKLGALLPQADHTLEEANRTLHEARAFLTTVNRAATNVEATVHEAHDVVTGTVNQLARWRTQFTHLFTQHAGNGARVDPRRRHGRR
jgi:uncharacterized protein YoxC